MAIAISDIQSHGKYTRYLKLAMIGNDRRCGSRKYTYPTPNPQHFSAFTSVHWASLFATFTCWNLHILICFMFSQWLFRVVTHEKYDETRVLSFSFLARSSEDPATSLIRLLLQSWPCSWNLAHQHVLVTFLVPKWESTWRNWQNV